MDFVVDQYFPILEALEEKVVELEEVVLDEKFIHGTTSRIYHLKREFLSIKRAVSPLVDVSSRLMRFDLDLVPEDTKPYFRDVYDHAMRINEMADTLREVLATALEANLRSSRFRRTRTPSVLRRGPRSSPRLRRLLAFTA